MTTVQFEITLPADLDADLHDLALAERHRIETEIVRILRSESRPLIRELRRRPLVETVYSTEGDGALIDAVAGILRQVQP
jgi:hypothetical protein